MFLEYLIFKIYTLKQGDYSISSYYTKLRNLWQELDNFRSISVTSCIDDCIVVAKIREYKDSDQLFIY